MSTEAAVPVVADVLNLTRAEVHGVVTFYHDFRREPAGRHVIKVCRAEACQSMGGRRSGRRSRDGARHRIGRDDAGRRGDARAGLLPRQLRPVAPAMVDGELYGRVDQQRADSIIDRRRSAERRMTRLRSRAMPPPCRSAPSGREAIAAEARGARTRQSSSCATARRGMFWLEPLVEVETAGRPASPSGRSRPTTSRPVRGGLPPRRQATGSALGLDRGDSLPQGPGAPDLRPLRHHRSALARRLRAHGGFAGLRRALTMAPAAIVEEVTPPACAAAAAPASRPASSGDRRSTARPTRNTSSATPTRATAALSPTAC